MMVYLYLGMNNLCGIMLWYVNCEYENINWINISSYKLFNVINIYVEINIYVTI